MKRRDLIAGLLSTATVRQARAQTSAKQYRLAILDAATPAEVMNESSGPDYPLWRPLFKELRRLGYVEGQNLTVARYSGRSNYSADLAREAVASNPDVILCDSDVQDIKAATDTIPIVAVLGAPVGIVASMAHPGGNITGYAISPGSEIWGKRLELLRGIVPSMSRVGFLVVSWSRGELENYLTKQGIALVGPFLERPVTEAEIRRVIAAMSKERADALYVAGEPEVWVNMPLVIQIAQEFRLPAIYIYRYWAQIGGLMAYDWGISDMGRIIADQIDQILRGTKAGDIPIYMAQKFTLSINLKTANALGLTVPPSLLASADEVIE